MSLQKQFNAKVYDQDGVTFLKGFTTQRPEGSTTGYLKSVPTFESRINSGFGQCVLDVALPFSDFDEGVSIDFMNIVKIYASTIDDSTATQTDTLIYTGFISKYEPYFDGQSNEGVRVTLLGLCSLTAFVYRGGGGTTTETTKDPSVIGKNIIDDVNSVYGGSLLSYSVSSVDTVGTNVSVSFVDTRCSDALATTGKLSGSAWWWKIDEAGVYWLKQKPATATHTLVVGRHIESITAPKDSEKVVNDVIVRWGATPTSTVYTDATSQATYGTGSPATGKRELVITDTGLTDQNASDQRGNKEIADNKDAKTKATIIVNTNYNIESIHVGDTCSIKNINDTFFTENILIVAVRYKGDTVEIDLDDFPADVGTELQSFISSTAGTSSSSSSSSSSSTVAFVDRETPMGSINGTNTSFTLAQTPVTGSEMVYLNGVLQNGGGNDYTASGTTLSFTSAPPSGSVLLVSYRTANGTFTFADRETPTGAINGSNTAFSLAHTPVLGSESVFLNGLLQNGSGNDYSISGASISFVSAPPSGSILLVSYRY